MSLNSVCGGERARKCDRENQKCQLRQTKPVDR